jgi:tetratricopeptide (TPR) repeat protein
MNKYIYLPVLIIIITYISCKTTVTPVKYDKKIDAITQEIQLIHQLINNENYDEAEKQIDKDLKLYPDDIEILHTKAWLYLQKGNYEDSEKIFLLVLEKNKSNPLAYLGLSRIYRITGKKEQAYDRIKTGLSYSQFISSLWFEKGLLEYEDHDYKQSLIDFTKANNLDLKNNDAVFFKYLTMLQLGRDLDEIKYLWESLLKNNTNLKSYYFLYNAEYFYESNKLDTSFSIIKNSLDYFSDNPYLLNFYSFLLYEKYKKEKNSTYLDDAEINITLCLDKSKKVEPEFIDTYLCIIEAKNDMKKLKEEINKYIMEFPDSQILINWMKKVKN